MDDMAKMPLRNFRNLIYYIGQTGPYKPKLKPGPMDVSMPPDQFQALFQGLRGNST